MDTDTIADMTDGIFEIDAEKYNKMSAYEKLVALTDIINWCSMERSLVGQTPAGEVRRGTEVAG